MVSSRARALHPAWYYVLGAAAVGVVAQLFEYWDFEMALIQPWRPELGVAAAIAFLAPRIHRAPAAAFSVLAGRGVSGIVSSQVVDLEWFASVVGDVTATTFGLAITIPLLRRASVFTPALVFGWVAIAIIAAATGTLVALVIAVPERSWSYLCHYTAAGALGFYAIGPLSLLARTVDFSPRSRRERLEIFVTAIVLATVTVYAFSTSGTTVYLVLPILVWLSVRGGPRIGAPAALAVGLCVHIATSQGNGPFIQTNQIAQTQTFLAVVFLSAAMLANFEEASEIRRLRLAERTRELDESRDRWRRFDEAAQEGILEVDADSVITYANQRFAEIVRRDPKELVGEHLSRFVGEQQWMEVRYWRHQAMAGEPVILEIGLITSERPRWGLVSVSPQLNDDGTYGGSSLLITDITAVKAAEIERIDLIDELAGVERTEQARLAQELHDGPLQDLTAVQVILDHLSKERSDEPIVGKAAEAMTDALGALRLGVHALEPVDVASGGLGDALHKHAMRAIGVSDIHVDVQQRGPVPTGPSARVLYRIGREAITNAARHASPNKILVTVGSTNGMCQMTVEDDGIGFDVVPNSLTGHMGLRSMRERARRANADLHIDSSGDGTTVTVQIEQQVDVPVAPAP